VTDVPFDPTRLLEVLGRHRVRFVVIGAIAAITQGYPLPTEDLDITPERAAANLDRLASALRELDARLRLPNGESQAFPIAAQFLGSVDAWTLTTDAGDLDLLFTPAGTRGYDDLRVDASEADLGTRVAIASLRDVIRMKEAAGRPKDVAQLPALRQTLEVIRERERRSKG
jgi:hypothetical protein